MGDTIGRETFLAQLNPCLSAKHLERIGTAYIFSYYAHLDQLRESGERYFEHPKAVALILICELQITQPDLIILALLHDVREDSSLLTSLRVKINFGSKVARWLDILTKQAGIDYHERLATEAGWQVLFVKLADRLHNQRTLGACDHAKRQRKRAETREHYLPLADKLLELAPKKLKAAAAYLKRALELTLHEVD